MADLTIRSRSNPLLKRVGVVQAGKDDEALVLEGDRLVDDALAQGVELELVLLADDRRERAQELAGRGLNVRLVAADVLQRLSELERSPGILALGRRPQPRSIGELEVDRDSLWLVVAGMSDPGNLGALARSAEAAGASALCVVAGGVSPWNSKVLRGSMGSLLRLPVVWGQGAEELARGLEERGLRQVRAETRGGTALAEFDTKGALALWVGAETGELPEAAAGFERVSIPMAGAVESLNVTVAISLVLFACGRSESASRGGST